MCTICFMKSMQTYTSAYLYKVCSILQVIHDVLYQTLSFLWFEGLLPENRWLAKVIVISGVVPTINHRMK